jgi:alkanesulfonate monooxygenase SsuD/methylene tetrahydromethanopterin reductase-like flavin-dependent oxidoreductase (luciferase family)
MVYDHPGIRGYDTGECWNTLSVLAATTTTIRLASSMSCIYYRSPYMLARQAADVDRISGGRLILGLGVGDVPQEFTDMGLSFPSVEMRHRGMRETVTILRGLWSGQKFEYHGEQWSAACDEGAFLGPVQQPHVPIVIGGGGERYTLRDVAHFADASNMGPLHSVGGAVTDVDIKRKFGKLREYLEEVGRPYESVMRGHFTALVIGETAADVERKLAAANTIMGKSSGDAAFTVINPTLAQTTSPAGIVAGTPDEVVAYYKRLVELGFQYFVACVIAPDYETAKLMGKYVIPAFS